MTPAAPASRILLIDRSLARVQAYLAHSGRPCSAIARDAGLNEGTLRRAANPAWSPVADTLRAVETVIPPGWRPPRQKKAPA